ncbi:MAG: hypothetical protein R3D00_23695 [Bacteroidia bacterium]
MAHQEQEKEKEHLLYQSIRQYQLQNWVKPIPGGFCIVRLFSEWKIALSLITLVAALIKICHFYSQVESGDSGWLTVFFLLLLAFAAFGFIFLLDRKVVFDLENEEIHVTLLGRPVFSQQLQDFTALSYLHGSTLYIEFSDENRIRIASLGQSEEEKKELENLQRFILEALER